MVTSSPAPFLKRINFSHLVCGGYNGSPVMVIGGRNDFYGRTSAGYGGYIKQQLWHNFKHSSRFL
jgi:hypothetical protein